MAGAILIVLAVLVLALLAIAIVYVLGIRSKSATVRTAARRFHHGVGNPLQLRSAGTLGSYASVIRHQGRRTGRTYETPVWAVPTEDGFVIAIVYGSGTGRPARDRSHGQRQGVLPGHAAANPSARWRRRVSAGVADHGRQDLRRPGRVVSRSDLRRRR
jgi:hypothetical protein